MLTIAGAVALVVAAVVDAQSLSGSLERSATGLAGQAQWRVVGPVDRGGLDQQLAADLAEVPGVVDTAAVVQAVTLVDSTSGDGAGYVLAIGVACEDFVGLAGYDCAGGWSPGTIALSARLADDLGAGASLRTNTGPRALDDAIATELLDDLNEGRVIVVPLQDAQEMFVRGDTVDAVYVTSSDDAPSQLPDVLAEAAGTDARVMDASTPPEADGGPLLSLLLIVSFLSIVVASRLVANTVQLSLEERRHDLATMRALGAPERFLRMMGLVQGVFIGLGGGALGIVAGVALARPLVGQMSAVVERSTGLRLSVHVELGAVLVGLAIAVGVSVLAAYSAGRRHARNDVALELRESRGDRVDARPPRGRVWIAVGIASVGLVAVWVGSRDGALGTWQPPAGLTGIVLVVIGSFTAAGWAVPGGSRLLARHLPRSASALRLPIGNVAREGRRAGAIGMACALAVGLAVVLGSLAPSVAVASTEYVEAGARNHLWVSTLAPTGTVAIDAKLSRDSVNALEDVEGVASVARQWYVDVHADGGPVTVAATEGPLPPYSIVRGARAEQELDSGRVLVGVGLARDLNLRPGSELRLPGLGSEPMTVGAIWSDPNGMGRTVTMTPDAFLERVGDVPPAHVLVLPNRGVSVEDLKTNVADADIDPHVVLRTPSELGRELASEADLYISPFWALQRGMLVVAGLSALSTLLLVAVQRQREHALLTALGMDPRGLRLLVMTEALWVAVLGSIFGAVAGVATLWALTAMSPVIIGLGLPFRISAVSPLLYGALVAGLVVLGATVPAARAARPAVDTLLRED